MARAQPWERRFHRVPTKTSARSEAQQSGIGKQTNGSSLIAPNACTREALLAAFGFTSDASAGER